MVYRVLNRVFRLINRQFRMVSSVMISEKFSIPGSSRSTTNRNAGRNAGRLKKHPSAGGSGHGSTTQQRCDQCSTAALDIIILIIALGACGFLFTPYFKLICSWIMEMLPGTLIVIGDIVYEAPVAYTLAAVFTSISVIAVWEVYQFRSRKCGNPMCKGLKNAMECDIQLETEECVKNSPPTNAVLLDRGLQLAQDQKELESELRKMAPPNGRAVLVFRARCGCPAARFEVWGSKKPRRSKK